MADWRFGAGIWMFCQFVDRYATDAYGPPATTLDAIASAGEVEGLEVLDINYPFGDGIGVSDVREALARHNLSAQAITPHIYMREFTRGAFTNPDPALRKRALDRCREGIEVARELGAKYVKFWPGQDGYDYPLQADYGWLWEQSVGAIRELANSAPDMQFAIEYKLKEPRTHMFFCNAATTILAIQDMGVDNVGVVLDVGHSLFAKETPAEALRLAHRFDRLASVEINDNWREWDDDLAAGSIHLVETLEVMLTLREIGWSEPLLLDQFPFRENPVAAARESIRTIRQLDALVDRIDREALADARRRQDALAAQRLVLDLLLT